MENVKKLKIQSKFQKHEFEIRSPEAVLPPTHLMTRIFSQLDCVDLLQCSLVCKEWYRDTSELREGWRNEYSVEAANRFGMAIKRETHPPSSTCSIRGLHSWCP